MCRRRRVAPDTRDRRRGPVRRMFWVCPISLPVRCMIFSRALPSVDPLGEVHSLPLLSDHQRSLLPFLWKEWKTITQEDEEAYSPPSIDRCIVQYSAVRWNANVPIPPRLLNNEIVIPPCPCLGCCRSSTHVTMPRLDFSFLLRATPSTAWTTTTMSTSRICEGLPMKKRASFRPTIVETFHSSQSAVPILQHHCFCCCCCYYCC
mmetsp:Transcript_35668/g.75095  ORF Transcript_35668/g.75095 Transcript_35668/m.75095 type:complete len:205 (+) Transcript_35668:254-868(+)